MEYRLKNDKGICANLAGTLAIAFFLTSSLPAASDAIDGAQQQTVITWYLFNYPPAYITEGRFQGQGYQDHILDQLEQALPQFQIRRVTLPLTRLSSNIEHGSAACAGALAPTPERAKHMIFSRPILYSLPIRLVVSAGNAEAMRTQLTTEGKVDLSVLATKGGMQGGIVRGRSYGDPLDDFLALEHADGKMVNAAKPELVFRMLGRGRISYTFGYPDEVGYYARLFGAEDVETQFVTLPIKGISGYAQSSVGCTSDPAGQAFIEVLDSILEADKRHAPWQAAYEGWIDGAARDDLVAAVDKATGP